MATGKMVYAVLFVMLKDLQINGYSLIQNIAIAAVQKWMEQRKVKNDFGTSLPLMAQVEL